MAPPCYADLGKQARDVFNKNYRKGVQIRLRSKVHDKGKDRKELKPYDPRLSSATLHFTDFGLVKLDLKTKTPAGVEFTVNGTSNNDTGRVAAALETKYLIKEHGLTLKEKWNTDNVLLTELSAEDNMVKGLKLSLNGTFAPQSGKKTASVKSQFKAENIHMNGDVDLDYAGPIFHGAGVLG